MTKKFFFLVVAILMGGMTAVKAKINYVPLYIIDTHADVKTVKRTPAIQLFITQDDHKLILPEFEPEDSLTILVLKDNERVYSVPYERYYPIVYLPTALVGDFEVCISADTYYYFGYITLESSMENDSISSATTPWDNVSHVGSNTIQQDFLDRVMRLEVVEYERQEPGKEDKTYHIGLVGSKVYEYFPQLVTPFEDGTYALHVFDFIPLLVSCIQELKIQVDTRTEKIVDIMMSRGNPTTVSEVRAAIGNTLLSVSPSSVSESAQVRYILGDDASNAFITVTDMGGRVMTRVPLSPTESSATIDSGILGEGIFLCTLYVDGKNVGTKRLVKTK